MEGGVKKNEKYSDLINVTRNKELVIKLTQLEVRIVLELQMRIVC